MFAQDETQHGFEGMRPTCARTTHAIWPLRYCKKVCPGSLSISVVFGRRLFKAASRRSQPQCMGFTKKCRCPCEASFLCISHFKHWHSPSLLREGGWREGGRKAGRGGRLSSSRCYKSCSLTEIASVLSRLKNAQAVLLRSGQHPWCCSIITTRRRPPPPSFVSKVGRFSSPGLSCSWKPWKSRPTQRAIFSILSQYFINKYIKERATVSLWRKLRQGFDRVAPEKPVWFERTC